MKIVSSPKLEGYWYPPDRVHNARKNNRLLSLRIETSLKCNLMCNYCSLSCREHPHQEMDYDEIIDVVKQAKYLGAESIVVIGGGEPTIYPNFRKLIQYIHSLDMVPVIFTNTTTMTKELSQFLFNHNTSIIGKLDSLKEVVQDRLVGKKGTYQKIMKGIANLKSVGYTDGDPLQPKLGLSFVVNNVNIQELPKLWRFCRSQNIFPNFEMMVPNQRAENLIDLMPTKLDYQKMKLHLLEIDKKEFGFNWLPYTPLLGCGCLQTYYSLYVTVEGLIRPCAAIQTSNVSLDKYSLKEVIKLPFFQTVRNVDSHLEGKCKNCKHNYECIGCRGMAFTVGVLKGEDHLKAVCLEDPFCFLDYSS